MPQSPKEFLTVNLTPDKISDTIANWRSSFFDLADRQHNPKNVQAYHLLLTQRLTNTGHSLEKSVYTALWKETNIVGITAAILAAGNDMQIIDEIVQTSETTMYQAYQPHDVLHAMQASYQVFDGVFSLLPDGPVGATIESRVIAIDQTIKRFTEAGRIDPSAALVGPIQPGPYKTD